MTGRSRGPGTLALAVVTAGLLAAPSSGALAQTLESDFIVGMPPLEPSPAVQGAFAWRKGGVDFGSYDRIMLDRVQFVLDDDSESKAIDPAQLTAVGQSLIERIHEAMEPQYPIVDHPGPGVIRLRLAITDVRVEQGEATKPAKGIFAFTPIGLGVNAIASTASAETDLSQARIEIEALDAASGTRIGIFIDPEPARHGSGDRSWDALQQSFTFYASRLRTIFDREHGR